MISITIEVSGRHVHLSRKDVDALFGKNYRLTPLHPISQKGQFATKETVRIVGPKGKTADLRIVGPERRESQIEISATDARSLGIPAVVRLSGNLARTPGITLRGPKGNVRMKRGVIIPQRHIHASPEAAKRAGVANGEKVTIITKGPRAVAFHHVIVRIHPTYQWHCHIDTDEGNAAGIQSRAKAYIVT